MSNLHKGSLNLEPIYTFLTEDISPEDFAKLLDELLYDYINVLLKVQLSDFEDKTIHQHADRFILYLKILKDILPYCEKQGGGFTQ